MDTFPDLGSLTDQELKELIKQLTDEEMEISYRRRILHGKIDILRAELVNRLRKKDETGELVISGADVQQLTDILAGRVPAVGAASSGQRRGGPALPRVRLCQRRRRQLLPALRRFSGAVATRRPGATTATYKVGETGELEEIELDDVVARGRGARDPRRRRARGRELPARARTRLTVGRRPDSDIFLDDVTVSRDHAILVRRGNDYYLDDCGSLNGTYVNRRRIESHRLADGDELQIGKYKLAFLSR